MIKVILLVLVCSTFSFLLGCFMAARLDAPRG